jgi:hypothetical protein
MRNLERRVERVERLAQQHAKVMTRFAPECICYPKGEVPWVGFPIQYKIAFSVKCPAHGDRFSWGMLGLEVYVSIWFREKMYRRVVDRCPSFYPFATCPKQVSEQFRKAYLASFPPDLWTGEEEEKTEEGFLKTYLRLQDDTRIQVEQYGRAKPHCDDGDGPQSREEIARRQKLREECDEATDRIWEMETLRTVGRLLSERGLIIDPSLLGGTA